MLEMNEQKKKDLFERISSAKSAMIVTMDGDGSGEGICFFGGDGRDLAYLLMTSMAAFAPMAKRGGMKKANSFLDKMNGDNA